MSKVKSFVAELESMKIDPYKWRDAREAGYTSPDYRLARDLEDLVIGVTLDRNIELKDGESLADVLEIVETAVERWPLAEETDVR